MPLPPTLSSADFSDSTIDDPDILELCSCAGRLVFNLIIEGEALREASSASKGAYAPSYAQPPR